MPSDGVGGWITPRRRTFASCGASTRSTRRRRSQPRAQRSSARHDLTPGRLGWDTSSATSRRSPARISTSLLYTIITPWTTSRELKANPDVFRPPAWCIESRLELPGRRAGREPSSCNGATLNVGGTRWFQSAGVIPRPPPWPCTNIAASVGQGRPPWHARRGARLRGVPEAGYHIPRVSNEREGPPDSPASAPNRLKAEGRRAARA